jgi:PAS domain-containing protein
LLAHGHPELTGAKFVVFTDSARRYVDCTESVCELLGYSRAELLTRNIEDVSFDEGDAPKLFAEYLQRGQMEGEYVLRHKSGVPIPIRYRALVFPDGCTAAIWEPLKDWRELYLAALVEVDPVKLKSKSDVALLAVQQRIRELGGHSPKPDHEQQALRDATSALNSLLRSS